VLRRIYGYHGTSQEGSISAFVVLFLIALFALMGMVLDGGSALAARQSATDEAEQAARAGAGALSIDSLRSGSVELDQAAAVEAAEQFTVVAGHPGIATVAGGTVTVQIRYRIPTQVLGIIGVTTLPVVASASAVDVEGVATGS
jgi:Flp pilus assembly protein TadG